MIELPEEEHIEVTYQEGFLIPVEPLKGLFDIGRDNALIMKKTHFFCQGHLGAIPIEEQSPDDDSYCAECLKSIRGGGLVF